MSTPSERRALIEKEEDERRRRRPAAIFLLCCCCLLVIGISIGVGIGQNGGGENESGPGACCLTSGNCEDALTNLTCADVSGVFQGESSTCNQVMCTLTTPVPTTPVPQPTLSPQPTPVPQTPAPTLVETGICCSVDGGCIDRAGLDDITEELCMEISSTGTFHANQECVNAPMLGCPLGNEECECPGKCCCLAAGQCVFGGFTALRDKCEIEQEVCGSGSGIFIAGSTCDDPCPESPDCPPTECSPAIPCDEIGDGSLCFDVFGCYYDGENCLACYDCAEGCSPCYSGVTLPPTPAPGSEDVGACCISTIVCGNLTLDACTLASGQWLGSETSCGLDVCVDFTPAPPTPPTVPTPTPAPKPTPTFEPTPTSEPTTAPPPTSPTPTTPNPTDTPTPPTPTSEPTTTGPPSQTPAQPTPNPTNTQQPPSPITPTPAPGPTQQPDCCIADPYVFPGSPFGSNVPNLCGNFDYNCDSVIDTFPCCDDSHNVYDAPNSRTIWLINGVCDEHGPIPDDANQVCGACNDGLVYPGWSCTQPLLKRFSPECVPECTDIVQPTKFSPPDISECAQYVTGCLDEHSTDVKECCITIAQ